MDWTSGFNAKAAGMSVTVPSREPQGSPTRGALELNLVSDVGRSRDRGAQMARGTSRLSGARRWVVEAAVVLGIFAGFYVLLGVVGAADWVDVDRRRRLEQSFFALPLVTLLVAVFAWRRCVELVAEARRTASAYTLLDQRESEFRSLFLHHPSAVFAISPQRRYATMNRAAEAMSGYQLSDLAALRFPALQGSPETAAEVLAAFEGAMGGDPQRLAGQLVSKDRTRRDVAMTMVPMIENNDTVGVYVVCDDVTDATLVRRRLDAAVEEAQRANRTKTFLLNNISHELRTPLTSVLAGAELLADTELDAAQADLLARIARNAHGLAALVEDLLEVTRIDEAGAEMCERPFDLRRLLDDHAARTVPKAAAKGLDLRVEVDGPIPDSVVGDPERLAQVLDHVTENAVKFTDAGQVGIRLQCAGEPLGDLVVAVFQVWDTGPGIEDQDRDHIFDAFTQADPTATRRHGGAGLGLALSRRLLRLMDGDITVASTPGKGSTFTLRLPLRTR